MVFAIYSLMFTNFENSLICNVCNLTDRYFNAYNFNWFSFKLILYFEIGMAEWEGSYVCQQFYRGSMGEDYSYNLCWRYSIRWLLFYLFTALFLSREFQLIAENKFYIIYYIRIGCEKKWRCDDANS